MGLTIHYDLHLPHIKFAAEARGFVKKLRAFAAAQGFEEVSKIVSWKRGNEPMIALMHEFPVYDEGADSSGVFFAKPLEMWFFAVNHPGSEAATFGLARYGKTARGTQTGATRPSNLPGWAWHHATKTQYASMENEGGWPNFFAIHDGICRMLDHAASLGANVRVIDESKYWEHRDPNRLRAEIDRWNAMIAAVVGAFKDRARTEGHTINAAPILDAPDFEHLEAKGQDFLQMVPEIKVIRLREPKGKKKRRPK